MKKGTRITMAEMNGGKKCGVCHNGQKVFKSSEQAKGV
jgi:c(7)-type cytochrome triheme protein